MKIIITSILALLISSTVTYGDSHDLEIYIRYYGMHVYKDYRVNDNKIEFVFGISGGKELEKYSKILSDDEIHMLIRLIRESDLTKLERRYINRNVEDGYRVSYEIKLNGTGFKTHTSNVYHPTLISICEKINGLLPNDFHMYIPSKTDSGMISFDQIKDTEQRH